MCRIKSAQDQKNMLSYLSTTTSFSGVCFVPASFLSELAEASGRSSLSSILRRLLLPQSSSSESQSSYSMSQGLLLLKLCATGGIILADSEATAGSGGSDASSGVFTTSTAAVPGTASITVSGFLFDPWLFLLSESKSQSSQSSQSSGLVLISSLSSSSSPSSFSSCFF